MVNEWFASYLSDRRMYVQYENSRSVMKTLNIGLPQGAVSSPYLFTLYINDMHQASDKLTFLHFADDTTVHMSGRNLRQLCVDMSAELLKVSEWMKANRLSLNVDKTSFMLFTHKVVNREEVEIDIGDRVVQQLSYYVFHDRVTLFFANNSLMQFRITMKFLHNFFLNHEVFYVHIPCLLILPQRSLLLLILLSQAMASQSNTFYTTRWFANVLLRNSIIFLKTRHIPF